MKQLFKFFSLLLLCCITVLGCDNEVKNDTPVDNTGDMSGDNTGNNTGDNTGNNTGGNTGGNTVSIVLDKTTITFNTPDESETITATLNDSSAADVTWSTEDEYIATVSDSGVVTSVAGGTVTITATLVSDSSISATCSVTVPEPNRAATSDETSITELTEPVEVIMCGDSMMRTYETDYGSDQAGWGQYLQDFFSEDDVTINNDYSMGGRSSRSFYNEDVRWPAIRTKLQENQTNGVKTVIFMQFGHNDQKDPSYPDYLTFASENQNGTVAGTYYDYLERYITEARELDASIVLFTPFVRKYFSDGLLTDKGKHIISEVYDGEVTARGDYPAAMKAVGAKHGVPVIDLTTLSAEIVQAVYDADGEEGLGYIYSSDSTHTRTLGALKHAEAAANALEEVSVFDQYRVTPDSRVMLEGGSKAFGSVYENEEKILSFKVTNFNVSDGSVTITSNDAAFTLSDDDNGTFVSSITLDSSINGSTVYVKFLPTSVSDYNGALTVSYSGTETITPDYGTSPVGTIDGNNALISLSGVGIEYVEFTGNEYELVISDMAVGSTIDGGVMGTANYFTSIGSMEVGTNSKTVDEVTYTMRMKSGGSSKGIQFTASSAFEAEVVVISSNSSSIRQLNLEDSDGNIIDFNDQILGTDAVKVTLSGDSAGSYVLISESSGLNFYYVKVTELE